jgi:murein DD-endopeptidase MepM/ murein hydrolase activator NlpD
MKRNRFKNTKEKLKKFFIKFKNKDTSFLIIALCVCLLTTALIWRYSVSKSDEGDMLSEETPDGNGNIGANVDPYEDYVQDIMDEYGKNEKDEEEEQEIKLDLKTMHVPLKGEVFKEFTMDDLVYFDAIGEWRVHNGVDIKSTETLLIESAFAGTVEKVSQTELTGIEIIIDHGDNTKTLYNNLSSSKVSVGDTVTKGQVIGNIGKVSSIESADGPHLHFEIMLDSKNVNPLDYFPAE